MSKTTFKFIAKETKQPVNAEFQPNQMVKVTTCDGDIVMITESGFKNFFEKNVSIEENQTKEGK